MNTNRTNEMEALNETGQGRPEWSDMVRVVTEHVLSPSANKMIMSLKFPRESVKVRETHLGTKVFLRGYLLSGKVGGPGLPSKTYWVALPPNTKVKGSVKADVVEKVLVKNEPTILSPMRAPLLDVPDKTLSQIRTVRAVAEHCAEEERNPRPLALFMGTHEIGGHSVAAVEVNPIYLEADGSLALASRLQITIPLKAKPTLPTGGPAARSLSTTQNRRWTSIAQTIVENPEHIPFTTALKALPAKYDYLIITDDTTWNAKTKQPLAPISPKPTEAFANLASWKQTMGFRARLVTVSEIVQSTATNGLGADFNSGSKDLQQAIKKFLKWAFDNWGTAYVLLGGDQNIVPARHLPIGSGGGFLSMPTDLYYANLNPANNWPEDTPVNIDQLDFSTIKPDLSVGRVPVSTKAEADTFVGKVIYYEQLAGRVQSQPWLHNALFVARKWGGDYPTNIKPAATTPPQPNQYYHVSGANYSLIRLLDKIPVIQDPNLNYNTYTKPSGKTYYKIHLQPTYKVVQDLYASVQGAKTLIPKNERASPTSRGWFYTDWLDNDGPCHNEKNENYPTSWIIIYLAPNEVPSSFEVQLDKHFRLDYNLLSKVADGDFRPIPYDPAAASTRSGWYFAKSATDITPSPIAQGCQTPTEWIAVFAGQSELAPVMFILDPSEEADTMVEQEQLRKNVMQVKYPDWDAVSRLYPDLSDLPAADRQVPDVQYYSKDRLKSRLNLGQHIVSIDAHGNSWGTCYAPDGELEATPGDHFDTALADQLANSPCCGILYANSCLTNRWTDDSLSKHLLVKNQKGGVAAYIGYADVISIGLGHFVEKKFFSDLGTSGILGVAHDARAAMLVQGSGFDVNSHDVRYTIFMMSLLGDPAMKVHKDLMEVVGPPVIDQANNPTWAGGTTNIHPANRVSQTFTPTMPYLAAVEVALRTGNPGRGGDQVTLRILDDHDNELYASSATVPEGFDGFLPYNIFPALKVTCKQPLKIQLSDTGKIVFFWNYAGGNPYGKGQGLFAGQPFQTNDFFFRTYGMPANPADAIVPTGVDCSIASKNTGKCLDVAGLGQNNGANVQQWNWWNGNNQQWRLELAGDGYFKLVARHSGKCLDVSGQSKDNGGNIQQWDWWGGDNQKWKFEPVGDGYFKVVAKHSGKCLDIAAAGKDNGANVQQYDYVGGDNQKWKIEFVGGGYFKLIAKQTGKRLDVQGNGMQNGANVQQYDWLNGSNQKWRFEPVGGGYYKIIVRSSGKCLDVSGKGMQNGANVQQWDWLGGDNQQWKVEAVDDGYVRIVAKHSGKCLDVSGLSKDNGGTIQQWDWWGGDNQKWKIQTLTYSGARSSSSDYQGLAEERSGSTEEADFSIEEI